jgi:hypothetical protein
MIGAPKLGWVVLGIAKFVSRNDRLHSFVRPILMAHLKAWAETDIQLDRFGMSDVDVILQLATSKVDASAF